ncbi:MAG: hypothetical protein JW864_01825 [Spirochaetes bacterium]|nr:hypothetical protein [Spirochaetota bacterium]
MNKYVKYFIISFTIITGCAYSGDDRHSSIKKAINGIDGEPVIPRTANKIYIPLFRNSTGINDISENLYRSLKEKINMDGRLTVVPEGIRPDLRLDGIITRYEIQPVKFNVHGESVRERIRITASLRLVDLNKNKEIFYEKNLQAFDEFSEKIPPVTTETRIRNKITDMLAERIALKTINGWYTKLMTPVERGK